MRMSADCRRSFRRAICGLSFVAALPAVGCQYDVGGQTLPSGYYLKDDIQYFPPGPEFKLTREAAAMKQFNAEQELRNGQP